MEPEHDAEIIWNRVGIFCFGHNEFLVKRMCAFKIMGLIFLSSLIKHIKLLIKLRKNEGLRKRVQYAMTVGSENINIAKLQQFRGQ